MKDLVGGVVLGVAAGQTQSTVAPVAALVPDRPSDAALLEEVRSSAIGERYQIRAAYYTGPGSFRVHLGDPT